MIDGRRERRERRAAAHLLDSPRDLAPLGERDRRLLDHLLARVGDAERVGTAAHAGAVHEIVVGGARHRAVLAALAADLEARDRVAVVADLHAGPERIAAVLEAITQRAIDGARHVAPDDRDAPGARLGDARERRATQVEVAGIAAGASVDDADDHRAARSRDLEARAAGAGVGVVGLADRRDQEIAGAGLEAARAAAGGVVERGLA